MLLDVSIGPLKGTEYLASLIDQKNQSLYFRAITKCSPVPEVRQFMFHQSFQKNGKCYPYGDAISFISWLLARAVNRILALPNLDLSSMTILMYFPSGFTFGMQVPLSHFISRLHFIFFYCTLFPDVSKSCIWTKATASIMSPLSKWPFHTQWSIFQHLTGSMP